MLEQAQTSGLVIFTGPRFEGRLATGGAFLRCKIMHMMVGRRGWSASEMPDDGPIPLSRHQAPLLSLLVLVLFLVLYSAPTTPAIYRIPYG